MAYQRGCPGPIGMESGRRCALLLSNFYFFPFFFSFFFSLFFWLHCIWSCGFRRFIQMSAPPSLFLFQVARPFFFLTFLWTIWCCFDGGVAALFFLRSAVVARLLRVATAPYSINRSIGKGGRSCEIDCRRRLPTVFLFSFSSSLFKERNLMNSSLPKKKNDIL